MDKRLTPLLILVIVFVLLAGIGQKLRQSGNFSHVIITTSDGLSLTFLRQHLGSRQACEDAGLSFATLMVANCATCQIAHKECLDSLTPEQSTLFGETSVEYPSARIPNGIITYHAADPQLAQAACDMSELQSRNSQGEYRVDCQQANKPRPLTPRLKQIHDTTETAFLRLSQALIGLSIGVAAYLSLQRFRNRTKSPSTAPNSQTSFHYWTAKLTLSSVDALILLGSFITIAWPQTLETGGMTSIERNTLITYIGLAGITILWFWILLEHYARRRPFWDELRETSRVIATMFLISGAVIFIARLDTSRNIHIWIWVLNLLLIPLGRSAARGLMDKLGLWQVPAVIIGAGENAREANQALQSEFAMGYNILAFIDVENAQPTNNATPCEPGLSRASTDGANGNTEPRAQSRPPVITCDARQPAQLEDLLVQLGKPQVIVALDSLSNPESQFLVQCLSISQHNIHIIPAIRGLPLFGAQASHFFSHEVLFLTVRNNLSRRTYRWVKRTFDLLGASLLLLLLSPLFLVLSVMIRKTGATAIYGHSRIGQNGKMFKCLKFRSMRPDADKVLHEILESCPITRAEWAKNFKLKNDPRITPIGEFLRKTSLDELPQLINVIKGEMSLVGPRPIVRAELERYGEQAAYYLQVAPGITGLWQISGRNDTTYAERVALDAWYVKNWSLWYDIAILLRTTNVVLTRHGAY